MSTTQIFKNNARKKCQRKAGEPTPKIWELQNGRHEKSHYQLDLRFGKQRRVAGERAVRISSYQGQRNIN